MIYVIFFLKKLNSKITLSYGMYLSKNLIGDICDLFIENNFAGETEEDNTKTT